MTRATRNGNALLAKVGATRPKTKTTAAEAKARLAARVAKLGAVVLPLPARIVFEFPLPSQNHKSRQSTNWRAHAGRIKSLRERCYHALTPWWGFRIEGKVDIHWTVYARDANRDSDSINTKAATDAIRDAGLWLDDGPKFVGNVGRLALKGLPERTELVITPHERME